MLLKTLSRYSKNLFVSCMNLHPTVCINLGSVASPVSIDVVVTKYILATHSGCNIQQFYGMKHNITVLLMPYACV